MDFRTWLIEQYHEQATAYRIALEREIQHTKRIFGTPLRDDVRKVLIKSLKEIEFPALAKYDGMTDMKIFNTTPKPNPHKILREVVEGI